MIYIFDILGGCRYAFFFVCKFTFTVAISEGIGPMTEE